MASNIKMATMILENNNDIDSHDIIVCALEGNDDYFKAILQLVDTNSINAYIRDRIDYKEMLIICHNTEVISCKLHDFKPQKGNDYSFIDNTIMKLTKYLNRQ